MRRICGQNPLLCSQSAGLVLCRDSVQFRVQLSSSSSSSSSAAAEEGLERRLISCCRPDRVEAESSLPLWVESVCTEAAADQEDTSHNHSCTEVEGL